MDYASVIALLKTALLLLTLAQGPNVPPSLKTQATTVANQAIAAATQALATTKTTTTTIGTTVPSYISVTPIVPASPAIPTAPVPVTSVTYGSLNAAVAAIGFVPRTLVISKPLPVTGSVIVPATLRISVSQGGSIVRSVPAHVEFDGVFDAPATQVFSGFMPGDISFKAGAVSEISPEWWGLSNSDTGGYINASAIYAAMLAGLGGPSVTLPAGTFTVGSATAPSPSRGGVITINKSDNPSGMPLLMRGKGIGVTILKLSPHTDMNVLELVNGFGNDIVPMPVTVRDLSIDGYAAQQQQRGTGDRYQNCMYLGNVSGLQIQRVECYGGAYHGVHANAISQSDLNIISHDNVGDGVVLTGNEAQGIYGVDDIYRFTVYSNGKPSPDNYDKPADAVTGAPVAQCDAMHHVCDAVTYLGIYAALQKHMYLEVNSHDQRFGQAMILGRMENSTIVLNSSHDYQGALALEGGLYSNTITADIRNGGTGLRDLGNGGDIGNAPIIRGNTFNLTTISNGQVADLGHTQTSFENNTITGKFVDLPLPAQGALMIIGPNFKNNTIQNFTAGDQQGAGNIAFVVQAYPNTGGNNIFKNGTLIGRVTSAPFIGLSTSDIVQNVQ